MPTSVIRVSALVRIDAKYGHHDDIWRFIHEKVTHVDDHSMLLGPGRGTGSSVFFPSPL